MRRGDVWWVTLPQPWGRRPVLLLARDEAYTLLSWVAAAPLTSALRFGRAMVALDPRLDGVPRRCVANFDEMQPIRASWLDEFIVRLRPEKMLEVERAIHFALGLAT